MMRFNEDDICRMIRACEFYKDHTGSEYMWEQYNTLVTKLKTYQEQYSTNENV